MNTVFCIRNLFCQVNIKKNIPKHSLRESIDNKELVCNKSKRQEEFLRTWQIVSSGIPRFIK